MKIYYMPATPTLPCGEREVNDRSELTRLVGGRLGNTVTIIRPRVEFDQHVAMGFPHSCSLWLVMLGWLAYSPENRLVNLRAMDFSSRPIYGDVVLCAEGDTVDGPKLISLPDDFRLVV